MDHKGRTQDKEEIPGNGQSMHGFVLTYSRFKGKTFVNSGFSTEGPFISASTLPHCRSALGSLGEKSLSAHIIIFPGA